MTPHERATETAKSLAKQTGIRDFDDPSVEAILAGAITTAFQAQSNEDEMRHREKQGALRDLLAKTLAENDKLRDEAVTARAELYRLTDGFARCGSPGPKAEGTIWCAECLEWYREEWAQHSPCAQEAMLAAALRQQADKCSRWRDTFESLPQEAFTPEAHAALYAIYREHDSEAAQDQVDCILASTASLDDLCRQRWQAGRAARGLSDDAPFEGDPLVELAEEIVDALNYCGVAMARTEIELQHIWLEELQNTLRTAWSELESALDAEGRA